MTHMQDADDLPNFERTKRIRNHPIKIDRSKPKSKRPWRGQRSRRSFPL